MKGIISGRQPHSFRPQPIMSVNELKYSAEAANPNAMGAPPYPNGAAAPANTMSNDRYGISGVAGYGGEPQAGGGHFGM